MEDPAGPSPSTSGGGTSHTEGNESDEQSHSTPPSKRMRYSCIFRKEHRKIFPWATDSRRGCSYAYCMRCSRDICMAQGGVKDLRKHESTALHSRSERSTVGAMPLSLYYGQSFRGPAVTEAKVKFGYFLGEHHLAFKLADHATKLFSSMFPDSAIAKKFNVAALKLLLS